MAKPKPREARHLYTIFMPVPIDLWVDVTRGHKTEFRSERSLGRHRPLHLILPTPVAAYRVKGHEWSFELMVLEAHYREPLGAISAESLEREGFSSVSEFRADWMRRTGVEHFPNASLIYVYQVRRWDEVRDPEFFGYRLLEHLYGEFL